MGDPTRLIEEHGGAGAGGGDTIGRELLLAARREGLPQGERDRLWAAVAAAALVTPAIAVPASAASAGAAGIAGVGPSGATAATAGGAGLAKITVAAVVLGAASLAGYHAARPTALPPKVVVVAPDRPTVPAPAAPPIEAPPPPAPAPARRLHAPAPPRAPSPSHLAAESRLVVEARRALREGDAAGALHRLEAGRAAFAAGALVQEREALTIEALARTGRTDAATARAHAFLRAYPHSPHESAIRVFASP